MSQEQRLLSMREQKCCCMLCSDGEGVEESNLGIGAKREQKGMRNDTLELRHRQERKKGQKHNC
jgi:hypothetical protein